MKITLVYMVLFLSICLTGCGLGENITRRKVNLGHEHIFVISRSWGVGGGHIRIIISANRWIGDNDLHLGEKEFIFYSIESSRFILHVPDNSFGRELVVTPSLTNLVEIKLHPPIEYVMLKDEKNIITYYPFRRE